MLPSFRLIAATFFLGFLVVFAGLRLATSFNTFNQALPVMSAHAAPSSAVAAKDLRRGAPAVPPSFDMRFAVKAPGPIDIAPGMPTDPAGPVTLPMNILPPAVKPAGEAAAPETLAALPVQPAPEASPAPAPVIDIPLPEPAAVDLTFTPPAPPEPRTIETKGSAVESSRRPEPDIPPAEPQSLPVPDSSGAPPEQLTIALPPHRPKTAGAAPRARTASVNPPRKKRTARRAESDNPFGSFDGGSNPFGQQRF